MRVLIAGGVFRLSPQERLARQPAPEITLVEGLRARGIDAEEAPLENRRLIARAAGFDLVHVHHLSRAAVAAALSPLARPFVFTEHQSGRAATAAHRAAQRLVLNRASAVVCLSNTEAAAKIHDYGSFGSRLRVIPNGIELPQDAFAVRRWSHPEPFTALFVGQLLGWKQVDRAIRGLTGLPENVRLRLVYHNNELETDLRTLASDLGVADRVTFVGQRSGLDLYAEYLGAHLLVLPSGPAEALPSVVTEALQTGLPVLGSDVGAIAEQVDGGGVIISADPSSDLSDPIRHVMDNYSRLAVAAAKRGEEVRRIYAIEDMIDGHLGLYRELTGLSP